ncbi:hypothetical protein AAFF_G00177140 [Aldrovandia affinis]|uniref:Uncharacterized protein n=1 Tax=Aldrovandia affinis TaxID=143900 RepID=A0AAD7RL84_9TELE|nr:hypothetical protein AAFF_G00177140 [Aldrovandia affinis]
MLAHLSEPNRWSQAPPFLWKAQSSWPRRPDKTPLDEAEELRKPTFCGFISTDAQSSLPDVSQFSTFQEMVEATAQLLHGVAGSTDSLSADDFKQAELEILRHAQAESFPEDLTQLQKVVLDPAHLVIKLLIKHYDSQLHHPGPERVCRDQKMILDPERKRSRWSQNDCLKCRKWHEKPVIPIADLPPCSLRLFRPAFYSTGMDCFGPFTVKRAAEQETVGDCVQVPHYQGSPHRPPVEH